MPFSHTLPTIQQLFFVAVTLFFLPLSTVALILNYATLNLIPRNALRRRLRRSTQFQSRTILLTGVGTPQGLRLARAFYQTGHNVVGADFELWSIASHARCSKAISKFYRLHSGGRHGGTPFIHDLLQIIQKERVDMWISCSDAVSPLEEARAKNIIENKTSCTCFVLGVKDAPHFQSRQQFLSFTKGLGLPIPERHQVKSRNEIHSVLNRAQGRRRYTLHAPDGTYTTYPRTLLPQRTVSQTYNEISRMKITQTTPWVLEQYIEGLEKYTTFGVVVQGCVKAFAASPLSESETYYQALPATSGRNRAMLRYVQNLARKLGPEFSGHLCIDFCIDERMTETGLESNILPIDCRIRAQASVLMFQGLNGSIDLARSYVAACAPMSNGTSTVVGPPQPESEEDVALPVDSSSGVYYLGQDILQLLIKPVMQFSTFKIKLSLLTRQLLMLVNHIIFWREGMYALWDPLPFWWLYHVYIPARLFRSILSADDRYHDPTNITKIMEV